MHERFWLYDWIDNCGIRDFAHAERFLRDKAGLADLRERSAAVPYTLASLPLNEQQTVVAGCGLDLSGQLSCFHWECAKEQLDSLFAHVWHYFDRIVVVGPSAYEISSEWNDTGKPPVRLATYIRLLLYVREIGADEVLVFRQKPPACELHLEKHLKEVGLDEVLGESETLIPRLAAEAKIEAKPHQDHIDYNFYHPTFVHNVFGAIKKDCVGPDHRSAITGAVIRKQLAALSSDLRAVQSLHCSLGATVG
jgi:hypothetical protein